MSNNHVKGRQFENKIARVFKGKRIVRPHWGINDLDVLAFPFGIECKYRQQIEHTKALEQVEHIIATIPERQGLLPLAVVQKVGARGKEEVVVRLVTLEQIGLFKVKEEIKQQIWILPLTAFLQTLDIGGFQYGNRAAEGSFK